MTTSPVPTGALPKARDCHDLVGAFNRWGSTATFLPVVHALSAGKPPDDTSFRVFEEIRPCDMATLKHGLLRWAVSAQPDAARQWEAVAAHDGSVQDRGAPGPRRLGDRDHFVEKLWSNFETEANHDDFQALIRAWDAADHYRRSLAAWFLQRYALPSALRVAGGTPPARRAAGLLLLVPTFLVTALACAVIGRFGLHLSRCWSAAVASLLCLFLLRWLVPPLRRLPFATAAGLMIPRLAATVAIGYLFLASVPDLARLLLRAGADPDTQRYLWIASVAVGLALTVYLLLHVERKVVPRPRSGELAKRAGLVLLLGLHHATLGLLVAAPVIFNSRLLDPGGVEKLPPASPAVLVVTLFLALAIGVVLETMWQDKPLTEPL